MMIGGYTTYDSITKEEDATGIIPLVPQQQDHKARILIEDEMGAADGGSRSLLRLFRRSIQTRSVAAILVGILVGASVLVALSATDRSGGGIGGRVAWRSSSRSSRTDTVVGFDKVATVSTALATVTLDDSCATTDPDYPGAGPCCDGGELQCSDVCDYLFRCDDGYVPELTDDAATEFPETSGFQPDNCHCRGGDYGGCFCQQVRDIVVHSVKGQGVGDCDPCLPPPPPPTPSPTTLLSTQTCREVRGGRYLDDRRRNTDTSKPFYSCFVVKEGPSGGLDDLMLIRPTTGGSLLDSSLRGGDGVAKIGAHCWTRSIQIHGVNVGCYPSGYSEDSIRSWHGTSGRGDNNCGYPCTEFDENFPFDHYCTIAKGVYHHHTKGYECYQYEHTAKYCWTFTYPAMTTCSPLGFRTLTDHSGEGWDYADYGPEKRSDLNSCGPPCTEFDSN